MRTTNMLTHLSMFVVVDRAGMRVLETPPATGPPFLERLNPALKHLAKVVRIDHGMLKACLALDAEAGSGECFGFVLGDIF